ncbi:MAG: RNA-binding protein [Clostridia bacterium]|nr:RNA-binding protein [Clostridia bacterium]
MDKNLLTARLDDLIDSCDRTRRPQFLGFLSEKEAALAKERFARVSQRFEFFGGYDGALRTVLGVIPEGFSDVSFPIVPLSFVYRKQDALSHRDFLGAVTGAGLKRERIGDILVEPGRAVLFADINAAKFILSSIDKVGRVGVTVRQGFEPPLPEVSDKKEFSDTVASTRLDCVIASLCGFSRKQAAEYIEKDLVSVNSFICDKPTGKVRNGDIISVRRKGRFYIKSVDGVSKKGRTVMVYDKYI